MVILQSDSTDFKVLDKKLILNLIEEYHAGDDKRYLGVRYKREGQIPGMRGVGGAGSRWLCTLYSCSHGAQVNLQDLTPNIKSIEYTTKD
jgi:hypothetical protein